MYLDHDTRGRANRQLIDAWTMIGHDEKADQDFDEGSVVFSGIKRDNVKGSCYEGG